MTRNAPAVLPEYFGRYQILRPLGAGGMGTVYLARDTKLDRVVALKVPRIRADGSPTCLDRFFREARAAATLHHPNICPVYDVGEFAGVYYLTMAFIEGKPLSDWVRAGKPMTPRQIASLIYKIASALQEAHKQGVVHRDLKPSNVMIDRRGEPVVMDFGLARRSRPGEEQLTRDGDFIGTPAYMAPEQIKRDVDAVGPGCDVYSLGVVLYELLAHRLPFRGDHMAIVSQVLLDEPPAPSSLCPGVDPALEAICLKAIAKRVEDRHRSMEELAAALHEYLLGGAGDRPAPVPVPVPAPLRTRGEEGIRVSDLGGRRSAAQAARPAAAVEDADPRRRRKRRPRPRVWSWVAFGAGCVAVTVVTVPLLVRREQPGKGPAESGVRPAAEKPAEAPRKPPDAPVPEAAAKQEKVDFGKRGREWLEKREYDKAIADFDRAVALDKNDPESFAGRGAAWQAKGDHDKAIADFSAAIALDPLNAAAYRGRARAWSEKKELDKAVADFGRAVDLRRNDAASYRGRGDALFEKQDFAGAIADWAVAVKIEPKYEEEIRRGGRYAAAYLGRGRQRLEKREYDQAIADFTEAVRTDPAGAAPYHARGEALLAKGQYDPAVNDFSAAIRRDPNDVSAFKDRGQAWTFMSQYDRALADYNWVLLQNPRDGGTYHLRGGVRYRRKEYEEAIADYNRAVTLDPKNYAAYNSLAWVLATCPDGKYRNGTLAVRCAMIAVYQDAQPGFYPGMGGPNADGLLIPLSFIKGDANSVDTLAAACAEKGYFRLAVAYQKKVMEYPQYRDNEGMKQRLKLYEQNKTYRQ